MDETGRVALERDVALLMRSAIASSLPGRARRWWRDAALAVNLAAVVVLLVLVASLLARPTRTVAPAVWTWTNPDTGVVYQCALISGDDTSPVAAYQCIPQDQ